MNLRIPFRWQDRKTVLLEKCLYIPAVYDDHASFGKIEWSSLFGNDRPIAMEFCCGNGQWIAAKAVQHPEINWVAVDKEFERARKAWAHIFRNHLANLFVVCGDAFALIRHYVPQSSLHEAYINFPDPWPKRRHAKHRIVCREFFDDLRPLLKEKSRLTIVTDDVETSERTLSLLVDWKNMNEAPGYITEWPEFGSSYFERLWRDQQRKIRYHQFLYD